MITTLDAILDNLTAIVVALVAVYGVFTWRRQRDADLAEEAIRNVYEARETIAASRLPHVCILEWKDVRQWNDMYSGAGDIESMPAQYLARRIEVFSKLESIKGLFCNRFGEAIGQHFDAIRAVRRKIIVFSLMSDTLEKEEDEEIDSKTRQALDEVIRRPIEGSEDKLLEEVDQAVTSIEAICRQELLPKGRWRAFRHWISSRIRWR